MSNNRTLNEQQWDLMTRQRSLDTMTKQVFAELVGHHPDDLAQWEEDWEFEYDAIGEMEAYDIAMPEVLEPVPVFPPEKQARAELYEKRSKKENRFVDSKAVMGRYARIMGAGMGEGPEYAQARIQRQSPVITADDIVGAITDVSQDRMYASEPLYALELVGSDELDCDFIPQTGVFSAVYKN